MQPTSPSVARLQSGAPSSSARKTPGIGSASVPTQWSGMVSRRPRTGMVERGSGQSSERRVAARHVGRTLERVDHPEELVDVALRVARLAGERPVRRRARGGEEDAAAPHLGRRRVDADRDASRRAPAPRDRSRRRPTSSSRPRSARRRSAPRLRRPSAARRPRAARRCATRPSTVPLADSVTRPGIVTPGLLGMPALPVGVRGGHDERRAVAARGDAVRDRDRHAERVRLEVDARHGAAGRRAVDVREPVLEHAVPERDQPVAVVARLGVGHEDAAARDARRRSGSCRRR